MRYAKKVVLGVMVMMCLGLFAGCSDNELPFNIVVMDAEFIFNDQFVQDNRTFGSQYIDTSGAVRRVTDESCPKNRTFVIGTQADLGSIFSGEQSVVDFDKENVVLHTFTSSAPLNSRFQISKATFDAGALYLEFAYKTESKNNADNSTAPSQRWLIIKMDKLEVTSVEIKKT